MFDSKLYQETFSQLRASDEAKEEIYQMMNPKQHNLSRLFRTLSIAAAAVMALAVTAGAVNAATDGALLKTFTMEWNDDNYTLGIADELNGAEPAVSGVEKENGRVLLRCRGQSIDITDELTQNGAYHFEDAASGTQIDVTGNTDAWETRCTVTGRDGSQISYTVPSGSVSGDGTMETGIWYSFNVPAEPEKTEP